MRADVLGATYDVLDHGIVQVVDVMGEDSSIVQAARVSYGEGTKTVREDEGLIRYLMRHHHTTPSEMCSIKLLVRLPIFVARQWIRHRTASVNEYSARYSVVPDLFYVPTEEAVQYQSKSNNQGREGLMTSAEADLFIASVEANSQESYQAYQAALENGVARELARMLLPVNFYTEWYWKIDLHNLLHFLLLRNDSHAQWEIRQYADVILNQIVAKWLPITYKAFMDYRVNAVTFTAKEMEVISRVSSSFLTHDVIAYLDDNETDIKGRERDEFLSKLDKLS